VPAGDFEARVRVISQTVGHFSVAGLMARRDDDHFIFISSDCFEADDRLVATRSDLDNVDSDSQEAVEAGAPVALRLVRLGDVFLASRSIDGGETWKPLNWGNGLTIMCRPDMAGPVQVGLWYGTFDAMPGSILFDDFMVNTSRSRYERGSISRPETGGKTPLGGEGAKKDKNFALSG
jgi:regulation of enolase protein 1 (concanavalin A-like superfamily)